MNKYIYTALLFWTLILSSVTHTQAQSNGEADFSVFQSKVTVSNTGVIVPTVVEVPFAAISINQVGFLVQENQTGKLIPSYFKESIIESEEQLFARSAFGPGTQLIVDNNPISMFSFPLNEDQEINTFDIIVSSGNPITSAQLYLELDKNVTLPLSVKITAKDSDGIDQIIVATRPVTSNTILFPETSARFWKVTLQYNQPLRIAELRFTQDDKVTQAEQSLRFLAQKGMTYSVFYNPDQSFIGATAESGDLRDDTNVRIAQATNIEQNAFYIPADVDYDGVFDTIDNCPAESNSDQEDIDSNGIGDACDDFDRDAVVNSVDNCVNDPNMSQQDEDGDGIGDVCDGQESRITERYTWVPWAGMGIAFVVLIALFFIVMRTNPKIHEVDGSQIPD